MLVEDAEGMRDWNVGAATGTAGRLRSSDTGSILPDPDVANPNEMHGRGRVGLWNPCLKEPSPKIGEL
jgi:hypothetical protein